ncbi:MAG TPA: hypothetical protein VM511_03670 [Luteolibacter sp.]|jgi:hypothetical protein|nr:hypothetical protein [Luteolibacter sp.]
MNTQPVHVRKVRSFFAPIVTLLIVLLGTSALRADIPDRDSRISLAGMYKVAASNDPFFPVASDREWFMDFGSGITDRKSAGKVAVSLRQNPNVKVRIMVWQVFPGTGQLYLGNQYSEGSRNAVAVADWKISNSGNSVILERHGFRIILNQADPADY